MVATANEIHICTPGAVPSRTVRTRNNGETRRDTHFRPINAGSDTCLKNIRCMDNSPFDPTQILIAGGQTQSRIGLLDLERVRVMLECPLSVFPSRNQLTPSFDATCISSSPAFSVVGCYNGMVSLRDASTLRQVGSIQSFSTAVGSVDCFENLLAVTGFSSTGNFMMGELRLHDIRMLGSSSQMSDKSLLNIVSILDGIGGLKFDASMQFDDDVLLWVLSNQGDVQGFSLQEMESSYLLNLYSKS